MKGVLNTVCLFLLLVIILDIDWDWKIAPSRADTVAVVYESSDIIPEPYVTGALNKLNEAGFQTRVFDQDITTGDGEVPLHIKEAIKAATNNGLPSLVVLGGGKVISVQDLPKTEQQIVEAVQ